jgi:hypothetical protein
MNARLALCLTCTTVAVGLSLGMAACGGDSGSTPGDDASSGTSSGSTSGSRSGSGFSSGTISSGSSVRDSSVTDSAGDSTMNDTGTDSTTADTGHDTSTSEAAADTGSDTSTVDSGQDASDAGNAGEGGDAGSGDAGDGAVVDAADAGETGAGGGPICQTSADSGVACNVGEHCCVNATTRTGACAAQCNADAGTFPVDCAGFTSSAQRPNQCGQTMGAGSVCCGHLLLTGATTDAGSCVAGGVTSQCAPSATYCPDNPPTDCTAIPPPGYPIRMCTATTDCTGDNFDAGIRDGGDGGVTIVPRNVCCSFGSPLYLCVDPLTATAPTASCLP